MSTRKDRLGRNPFERGTYSKEGAKPASSKPAAHTKARTKKKPASKSRRAHKPTPAWRIILDELDRRSPPAIRQLQICKRVAALADLAVARFVRVARQFEA